MFRNLSAELARNRMSIKALAEATGITYDTLKNKMSGVTEFKLAEMVSIAKVFPGCTMDYLFASDDDVT